METTRTIAEEEAPPAVADDGQPPAVAEEQPPAVANEGQPPREQNLGREQCPFNNGKPQWYILKSLALGNDNPKAKCAGCRESKIRSCPPKTNWYTSERDTRCDVIFFWEKELVKG